MAFPFQFTFTVKWVLIQIEKRVKKSYSKVIFSTIVEKLKGKIILIFVKRENYKKTEKKK